MSIKKHEDMLKFNKYRQKINVLFWDGEELLRRGIISNSGCAKTNKKYRDKEIYVDNWETYKTN